MIDELNDSRIIKIRRWISKKCHEEGIFHCFNIENELLTLLDQTNFKNNLVHLPFQKTFLNIEFEIKKGYFIHDVYLTENLKNITFTYLHTDIKNEITAVASMGITKQLKMKSDLDINLSNLFEEDKLRIKNIKKEAELSEKKIINLIGNFLNYLDSQDVQTDFIDRTKFNPRYIEKKLKKGKVPKPYIHNVILIGKTKQAYEQLKKEHGVESFKHAFWVRGHWRHLEAIKYKIKRYQNIWIIPYIKGLGKGDPINKKYTVSK